MKRTLLITLLLTVAPFAPAAAIREAGHAPASVNFTVQRMPSYIYWLMWTLLFTPKPGGF